MPIVQQLRLEFDAEKRCNRCGATKPLTEFGKHVRMRDGLTSYCKPCISIINAAIYQADRDRRLEYVREYRRSNQDKIRAHDRIRNTTKERREQDRRWKLANRSTIAARKRLYYAANRQAIRRRSAEWIRRNPGYSRRLYWRNPEQYREYSRRRRAIKNAASVIPFTPEQLQSKCAFWGNCCWVCKGPQQAIDHVKPLSKGGLHVLANLRPICWSCNSRKHDTWPYPTGGYLI